VLFALLLATVPPGATAQEAGAEGPAEPVMVLPALIDYVKADYPPQAFAEGLEAEVVATIDVDENGLVTAVEVTAPAGHGFDEAAVDAMFAFVFSPATLGGEPIPSRVVYRYTFFIGEKEPEPEEAAAPPPCALAGFVRDLDGAPLPRAVVIATPVGDAAADGKDVPAPRSSETGDDGAFAFAEMEPGSYQVEVAAPGYRPYSAGEDLAAGERLEVVYRLEAEAALYETVVRATRPLREVTRREVTTREITRIPGTGGDALRAIQNMPGMARAMAISGALIVRGSAPEDTQVFFDSIPMPLLYHFGGLTSVVNSDLLERIDFYPGNYSVRYGGATGGIVDVYPRAPRTDRLHAYVDADVWDVGALVETPIGDDWSVAVAARRSYIDGILNAVLPEDGGFQFTTAPRYWDYQAVADHHPDRNDNLRLFLYGSDDRLVMVIGDDVTQNPNLGGGADVRLGFHILQGRWDHRFGKTFSNQINVGGGIIDNEGSLGEDIVFLQRETPVYLRDELVIDPGRIFILRTGIDAVVGWARWRFRAPLDYPQEGTQWDPMGANTQWVEDEGEEFFYRPGWYGELELTAIPMWRFIYGLRVDYFARVNGVGLDPRFVARFALTETTTLKAGLGLFHQAPDGAQANDSYGNPDLEYLHAIHYGLGVEQRILENIEIGLEGFYKEIGNLVVPSERMIERGGEEVPEVYSNEGRGRVYGMELMVKHNPTDRFFGWIAYTLMRSARVDHPGEDARLFDHDQTHILTVVASLVLGRGWEAGLRFRLASGDPDTPVVASAYDADSDIYWPVYGATNSDRLPLFHQLDLRVDKKLRFGDVIDAAVYVEVQNIYNRRNAEGYSYSYDYSHRNYFYGLPLIPSLGIKLEY